MVGRCDVEPIGTSSQVAAVAIDSGPSRLGNIYRPKGSPIVGVGAKLIADKLFKTRTVPSILDMVLATRALKVLGGYFYPPLAQFLVTLP